MKKDRKQISIALLTVLPVVLMPYAFIRIAQGHREPILANIIIADDIPFIASLMWWTHQTKWILEPLFSKNPKAFFAITFTASFVVFLGLKLYFVHPR